MDQPRSFHSTPYLESNLETGLEPIEFSTGDHVQRKTWLRGPLVRSVRDWLVALQWLGAQNMSEADLFETDEAPETVGVDRGTGSHILLGERIESGALEVRNNRHPYTP